MAEYKGTREAFAAAMMEMAATDDRIMFVSPDSLKAMRATTFAELYPKSYVEVGIAEQGAVNVASGLASTGLIPYVATYAGFLTMRACEQIRTFVAYTKQNVKFVGINAGLMGGEREGVTHQFYEDMGILSNIPNMTIFSPADGNQAYYAVKEAAKINGPVYIRAGSGRENDVFEKNSLFNPLGVTVMKDYGTDAVVFTTGYVLDRALEAAELLKKQGLSVTIADVNILFMEEPLEVIKLIKSTSRVVTIEDHNINGGLGSYISKVSSEHHPVFMKRIGLTTFGESGPAKVLGDHYGFSPEDICKSISNFINK